MLQKRTTTRKQLLCALCLGLAAVPAAANAKSFGVHSTEDYQNVWQDPLTGADTCMSRMNGVLDDNATQAFWYGLDGKAYYWHDSGDQQTNSLESVDMFVAFTHGGATSSAHSQWAMWNQGSLASSDSMRLGDESTGMSIFTQFSCETVKFDDYTWSRWDSVFAGGLRAVLGSHNTFAWGSAEYDVGKTFAEYLNAGNTLKTSWAAGWDLTLYNNQDVAVMFTGTDQANCEERRDNMRWNAAWYTFQNFNQYPRLQDGSIGYWCGWYWDDI